MKTSLHEIDQTSGMRCRRQKALNADVKLLLEPIANLVRVDRLKAIKVFSGFSRLGSQDAVPPDIVGL